MKKFIALTLALVCAFTLAGCGKGGTADVSGGEGPVKLLWYTFGDKQQDHDLVMTEVNKILKEKLNVELQVSMIDFGSYENKIGLSISANEPFDICFTSNWLNKFIPNVLKGAYLPLDDLIGQYAPSLKDALPQMVLDVTRYQGKTYAIPNYQVCFGQYGFIIQKELAEKYNLDLDALNKLEDIEPFLRTIKENEPNLIPVRTQSYDKFRESYEEIDPVPVYVKIGDQGLKAAARVDIPEARAS
ncbi:MAG: extracellular solute-binding protein, partial [Clostridiales bacterium]|nr:extracellular solute-binding protein [Clostridiales bacterium]